MLSIQQDAVASHRSVPSITNTLASSPSGIKAEFRSRESRPNSVHGGASPTRDKTVRIGHIVKYRRNTFTPKHARAHTHTCTHYRWRYEHQYAPSVYSHTLSHTYSLGDGERRRGKLRGSSSTYFLSYFHFLPLTTSPALPPYLPQYLFIIYVSGPTEERGAVQLAASPAASLLAARRRSRERYSVYLPYRYKRTNTDANFAQR